MLGWAVYVGENDLVLVNHGGSNGRVDGNADWRLGIDALRRQLSLVRVVGVHLIAVSKRSDLVVVGWYVD